MRNWFALILAASFALAHAMPDGDSANTPTPEAPATATEETKADPSATPQPIVDALNEVFGDSARKQMDIAPSPVDGLYEVIVDQRSMGRYIFYISANGQFIVRGGEILDLAQDSRNLTADRLNGFRQEELAKVDAKSLISFPAADEKHVITVFTDVDCPYCSRIHQEVPKLNEKGVTVRYAAFPRAGKGSPTYKKMESVWCAKDRNKALTQAKAGKSVKSAECDHPMDQQHAVGQKVGVNGTPAILLASGRLLPGFMPTARLLRELEREPKPEPK